MGVRHAYIKPRTPRLNDKVERSHGTDQRKFYLLLTYDDVDLHAKFAEWKAFYNYHRPHGGLRDKTPYECLIEKMR
ncbi:MAG: integrase core domain-containing protein [Nitrosomonas sp.]|nr:integrase core domain-containing protein [Nitrosomonas sp.]